MMSTRAHSRWQQAAQVRQDNAPDPAPVDLSKPDAQAAALAEKLQAIHTQITFIRIVRFIGRWVIRPIVWWPIKYLYRFTNQIMVLTSPSPEIAKRNREAQRRRDFNI
ncbi:hypothetical protein [Pollutimonas bauzanensis]|uniref:Uncharacterized protein n=1 Tax=Pollutimonas bauzanensis TaxID=658167 RepID=A0A1M5YJG6_9BURK|nr:hypothetical protein [Pollutimonas bauzanensis]SHI11653.1 hypothetical protein SAMN04488135_109110 [Pollutimonas bauzanensis]